MRKHILVIMSLMLMGFVANNCQAAEKNACINLEMVFNEYQKTKDEEAKLTQIGEEKQKEIDVKLKEIDQMEEDMDLMNDSEKEKMKVKLDKKMEELRQFDRQIRADLMRQRNEIIKGILDEIDNTVQEYGKSKGYNIIFNSRTAILYQNKNLDITQTMIEYLNKSYKKRKK
ncbi:MAG: OmpH family outer membrane protein [Candidatus Saelkia tenebricola]|nr:OmpH family outer membrane protein [Candidatus Saelkia tenebricola]